MMIQTYKDLQAVLAREKRFYISGYVGSAQQRFLWWFTRQHAYVIWRYVRLLRICEYLLASPRFHMFKMFLFYLLERKRNNLGNKLGFCIPLCVFGPGLKKRKRCRNCRRSC